MLLNKKGNIQGVGIKETIYESAISMKNISVSHHFSKQAKNRVIG